MLLDIVVYGLIAIYVGLVILGHVFLLRALIRRTASKPESKSSTTNALGATRMHIQAF